jgi:hypothetical protein
MAEVAKEVKDISNLSPRVDPDWVAQQLGAVEVGQGEIPVRPGFRRVVRKLRKDQEKSE